MASEPHQGFRRVAESLGFEVNRGWVHQLPNGQWVEALSVHSGAAANLVLVVTDTDGDAVTLAALSREDMVEWLVKVFRDKGRLDG